MSKESKTQGTFERSAAICMAFVCAISLLAAIGWLFNQPILASLRPEYIPMAPATALLLLGLCGVWLIHEYISPRRGMRILIQAALLGMLIIVIMLALRYFTGLGPDLEKLLYPAPPLFGQFSSARMSPLSALAFFLAIPGLLLLTGAKPGMRIKSASALLSLALFVISSMILLGYLYGAPPFYGGTFTPVALTSALAFWFLSLGLLLVAGPAVWPVRVFIGASLKARLMRTFIPVSLLIVLLQGLLSTAADPWVINPAIKVAVAALVALLIDILIISLISNALGSEIERGRKAEQALLKSEIELRALFAGMTDVVIVYDTDGRYIEIAPTNPANLYRPPVEMLGKTLRDVLPKEQADSILSMIRMSIQTNQVVNGEYALQIDGKETFFSASASRLTETTAIVVAHDITERKRVEQALTDERNLLRTLMDNLPDHIYFKDRLSRFTNISKSQAEMFGLRDSAEALGKTDFDFFSEEHARSALEVEQKIIATGQPLLGFEEKETWPDGRATWVKTTKMPILNQAGDIIGTFGISSDITEQKRAEQALQENEEKFRNLFNNAEIGMFRTRLDGSEILDMNEKYISIFGRTPAEMQGSTSVLLWADPHEREEMVRQLETEGRVVDFECGMLNKQGQVRRCLTSMRLYRKEGILEGSILDITERERNELIQNAIFRITQAAITSEGMDALYRSIHSILGELIPAENFFIALIEPASGEISFPYYIDQFDEPPVGMTPQQGLTGYIIRTGRPLLATRQEIEGLVQQGQVERLGSMSVDWMGAPLKVEGRMIGVMAVQSYKEGIHFNQEDLNLLEFVSTQVAQVIERRRMEDEIRNLSLTDELTGLYNRRGFTLLAEQTMKQARRKKRSMLLIFGDVDNLKMINDTYGHAQGDQTLKEVSAILRDSFREADIVARVGGDEFVVLAVDSSKERVNVLTNRIQSILEKRKQQGDRPYQMTISLGIAHYDPKATCTISELIAQADSRMYQQKQEKKRIKPQIS